MDNTTITFEGPGGKKAILTVGSEANKVKNIGTISYSPALNPSEEVPVYAKLAQTLRAKLVD